MFSMKFEAFPLPVLKVFPGAGDGTAAIWSSNGMRLCTLDWGGDFERQTMRTMREGFIWFLFGVAG